MPKTELDDLEDYLIAMVSPHKAALLNAIELKIAPLGPLRNNGFAFYLGNSQTRPQHPKEQFRAGEKGNEAVEDVQSE